MRYCVKHQLKGKVVPTDAMNTRREMAVQLHSLITTALEEDHDQLHAQQPLYNRYPLNMTLGGFTKIKLLE
jgi:hypothetical protein